MTFITTVAQLSVLAIGLVVNFIPTVFYIYGIFAFRQYLGQ